MPKTSVSINLLKEKKVDFFEKFISWILTFGRMIVILTETIALLSFLYRFSLDRKLVDYHDKIVQKETIIRLQKANEEKYRDIQNRLSLIAQFDKEGEKTTKILDDIINLTPENVTFNNLVFAQNNLNIEGRTTTISSVKSFIEGLRNYSLTNSVSLNKIENKTSNSSIVFSITITFSS